MKLALSSLIVAVAAVILSTAQPSQAVHLRATVNIGPTPVVVQPPRVVVPVARFVPPPRFIAPVPRFVPRRAVVVPARFVRPVPVRAPAPHVSVHIDF